VTSTSDIFDNPQIAKEDLPQVQDLIYNPLESRYLTVLVIGRVISSVITLGLLLFLFLLYGDLGIPSGLRYAVAVFALLIIVWRFIAVIRGFKYKEYAVRKRDLIYREGWLSRHMTTTPFNRIQHVTVDQGIIERNFNLARLRIYTAGGRSSDITIPGLDPITADQLKEFIIRKIQQEETIDTTEGHEEE